MSKPRPEQSGDLPAARVPKYVQIARTLRGEIGTRYLAGDFLPSERTLQKAFGATPATIRSTLELLSKEGLVETLPYRGTLVRPSVEKANSAETVSRDTKSVAGKTVALVMPLDSYLVLHLMRGVEQELRRHDCRLQLCGTYTVAQRRQDITVAKAYERQVLASLAQDNVLGAIWWSAFGVQNQETARTLQAQGRPLILVDNPVPGLNCDTVGVDDYGAAFHATQHLLRQGHTNLAFWGFAIDDLISPVVRERLAGFLAAQAQANPAHWGTGRLPMAGLTCQELLAQLPPQIAEQVYILQENAADEDTRLVEMLLTRTPRPTAILAANDHIAYKFIQAMEAQGFRVPRDFAVASFGDIDRDARQPSSLTTVRQPFEEIGQRAVRLLFQRVNDPTLPQQHLHLPTELIIRDSCGASERSPQAEQGRQPAHSERLCVV